ncbi:MAG: glycoside hydrolase family 1 protein [Chloroflexi bacterium]|nr:glycoside hydrolase family 1 protein [Chloroflexota bacterium]
MPKAAYHFPRGFLWGTATAAHQVEGNNTNNNWWAWEQDGHTVDKSGLACDWWGGRWKEDFDRAAEAGQNAHRLSVEWSRIQPDPDRWDENALDRYRQMLRGLRERGMTAMVTLHHFSDPLWLMEQGGWENGETPGKFADFVRKTMEALKEYTTLWVTINEPNVYAYSGYVAGAFPPGKKDMKTALRVMTNLVRGHAQAYRAIHEVQREARVGMAVNYRSIFPANPKSPLDRWVAKTQSGIFNDLFPRAAQDGKVKFLYKTINVPEAAGTQDFIGLNYYSRDYVTFDLRLPGELFGRRAYAEDADLSDTGFIANEPAGFFEALKWARGFGKPIIVTENGVEDADDHMRPRYLAQHIHQLWRAVNFNWRIKGYFHWSLVDNFEWERGWTQRFGLWELDVETQARRKRPSADLYAEICKENGLSSEMVEKYCPEALEKIFPE